MTMIQFTNVAKHYDNGKVALNNITFHLDNGEMVFLTGHSGAGKTTLLKLISTLETCTRGQIIVAGKNLSKLSNRQIPYLRRSIGIIFQNPYLMEERTVYDNIAIPLIIAGYSQREIGKRVRAALDKVGLLGKEKLLPLALSGGEQQRVSIARAIINKPSLILADEPTGNLDPELSVEIMKLFEEFNQVGVSVLIATHNLALIAQMRHRILTLKKGHLIHGGEDVI